MPADEFRVWVVEVVRVSHRGRINVPEKGLQMSLGDDSVEGIHVLADLGEFPWFGPLSDFQCTFLGPCVFLAETLIVSVRLRGSGENL